MRGPLTDDERLERIKELWDAEDLDGLAQIARLMVEGQRAALKQMEDAQKATAMAWMERDQAQQDALAIFRCWLHDLPLPIDTRQRLSEWQKQWPEPEVD